MSSKYITAVISSADFKCKKKNPLPLKTGKSVSSVKGLLLHRTFWEAFAVQDGLLDGSCRKRYLYGDAHAMNSVAEIHTQKKSKIFKGCR